MSEDDLAPSAMGDPVATVAQLCEAVHKHLREENYSTSAPDPSERLRLKVLPGPLSVAAARANWRSANVRAFIESRPSAGGRS